MKQSRTSTTQTKGRKRTEEEQFKKEIIEALDTITDIVKIRMIYGFVKGLVEIKGAIGDGV